MNFEIEIEGKHFTADIFQMLHDENDVYSKIFGVNTDKIEMFAVTGTQKQYFVRAEMRLANLVKNDDVKIEFTDSDYKFLKIFRIGLITQSGTQHVFPDIVKPNKQKVTQNLTWM